MVEAMHVGARSSYLALVEPGEDATAVAGSNVTKGRERASVPCFTMEKDVHVRPCPHIGDFLKCAIPGLFFLYCRLFTTFERKCSI